MRIAIVEDHVMFREVLRKICEHDLHHKVVGEAGDGREAVELAKRTKPDLILLDLHLPNLDGFGVIEEIRKTLSDVAILVLSSHCDEYTVFRAEHAGIQGFVDKNTNSVAALKDAIAVVASGKVSFSDAFKRIRAQRLMDPHSFDKVLGNRERTVLAMVGLSWRDSEIAAKLGISEQTVSTHRLNIVRKLGLSNTTELVRYAREHGFTLSAPQDGSGAMLP
ncbi:MAG TPA: response regulator transcription factor [Opitutaceae bacterium]|nr:response regulator transcription factor [Opitutaceae bacterium]